MDTLKRFPIKYIRDYIKKDYKLKDECFICGTTNTLELHHLYSVSELFSKWCISKKIKSIESVDLINKLRIEFSEDEKDLLSNKNLFTLCKNHHIRLHTIYGQTYANHLVPKIKNWLLVQREKHGRT
jgi:5-methylcytosine-specific restriction endonuclease McrA